MVFVSRRNIYKKKENICFRAEIPDRPFISSYSILTFRSCTATPDELDIPEFKQYNKEIYESSKSGNRRRRKTTREDCDTASSLDGYDGEDGNGSDISYI